MPALVGLVQRELIQPGRSEFADEAGYRFSHILVRDAAYQLLSKRRRAELHARLRAAASHPGMTPVRRPTRSPATTSSRRTATTRS